MLKDGEKGAVVQRDKESYAIVPQIPLGLVTPEVLRKIADVADKYELAALKITGAARIAMVGFKEDEVDAAWKDLGMEPAAAVGKCVRSIKACPGTTLCRLGKQDALTLGTELDKKYHGYELPNKCKIGVSGCINNCAEVPIKDLGFLGKPKGWTVFVGGNAASKPRFSQELIANITTEEALALAEKIFSYYKAEGKKTERIGKFIDRVGFDVFKENVL